MEQQYFCPECKYSGAAAIREHADVFEALYALEDDHRAHQPECPAGYRSFRVRNKDCSEDTWKEVTHAG